MPENLKVLVVDDSQVTRALITRALHHKNIMEIDFASDGEEAKGKVEGVDFIITDWMMPKLDGIEFTRWLRSMWKYRDIPVLLITSNFEEADLQKAREAGVNMFIEKTFSPDDLYEAIDKVKKS
jgi:two-component system chemotaxis response regulator CheY